jgi:hypothetical protein
MMIGGAEVCTFAARFVPGSEWLRKRFVAAAHRVEQYQRPS